MMNAYNPFNDTNSNTGGAILSQETLLGSPATLQADLDPYAPSIVQDLLAGTHEWRNI